MSSVHGADEFPEDCLPPERDYPSRDALFASINAWAAPRGYAFTTGRSTKEKSGKQTVTFSCDRAVRPSRPADDPQRRRRRRTTTRGTGCHFSVLAKESLDRTRWSLKHRPGTQSSTHNHAPSRSTAAHPVHRALSSKDQVVIDTLTNVGLKPKEITAYLRQNSTSAASRQDIYNCIAKSRRKAIERASREADHPPSTDTLEREAGVPEINAFVPAGDQEMEQTT
ncbi:hypothetical protein DCS_05652 [Drechmeria coniospora]|uniref:FAR1 domain-containing protein n=1 Tax=Drechmeria coniospora TaxID=98403 RepID=A0A151GNE8_DRECN|nr:hypothetical protein DCS_05652 [Drechmeria coniospora]KYK58635.1 hypothetical protein DCS_05652 [Drechmeria coniospora]